MKEKTKNLSIEILFRKRLIILLSIVLLILLIWSLRLVQVQIIFRNKYRTKAVEQWTKGRELKSKRGAIYDRNGKRLALSVNSHTLWINPDEVSDKNKASEQIGTILKEDKKNILEKLNTDKKSIKLKQWLTEEETELIKKTSIKGIKIDESSRRYYPYNNFASHVLGFTDIDNVGLNGIERTYNNKLYGQPGKIIRVQDGRHKQLPYDKDKTFKSRDGSNIVLTIDQVIQDAAEKAAGKVMRESKAKNVSIIAMNPNNGDILAMANNPGYNPNNPREPISKEQAKKWESINDKEIQKDWDSIWRNVSISNVYEPGSTFKTIVAAAGIEENLVKPNSSFYCTGFIRDMPGTVLRCSRWYNPHKSLTFEKGFSSSCNIVFVDLGRKLGKENMIKYIKAFGFGEKTGIELLGEEYGLVPNNPDLIKDVQLATMSYGHSLAVTPIQLINAISTISNGGKLMKPRLVSKILDDNGQILEEIDPVYKRQVISKSTSDIMMKMMENVVSDGTGRHAYIPGYRVGGKTGTAKKYVDGKYVGSFVGVAPVDDPKIALLVVVDEPKGAYYGGSVAAPVAKEVLEKALKHMGVKPKFTEKEKQEHKTLNKAPSVIGLTVEQAGSKLLDLGYRYNIENISEIDSSSKIIKQYPEPDEKIELGAIIDIYTKIDIDKGNIVLVPDLIGKEQGAAIEEIKKHNLTYKIKGKGKVKTQKPKPGEKVKKNSVIEIELE